MSSVQNRGGAASAALFLLLPAVLVLFYLLPFIGVAGWSFTRPELGLQNYDRVLTEPNFQSILIRTLRICAITTVVTLIVAYTVTYAWLMGSPLRRRIMELCVFLPFWISVLVRAFGWLVILRSNGLANAMLMDIGLISERLTMGRTEFAVILGMVHFMVPFAVFPMATVMRRIDAKVLLAAYGLGASAFTTFWTVYFPLSRPGLYAAAVMVFVFSLGFFVTPTILGGGKVVMIAEAVFVQMFITSNWGIGAALSVTLLVAVSIILFAFRRVFRISDLAQ